MAQLKNYKPLLAKDFGTLGLNASFEAYSPLLQQVEGGYQNNTNDPGNKNSLGQYVGTNHGISARWYESILGYPPSKADMLAITKSYAKELFLEYFWLKNGGDKIINQAVANTIIDHEVNAGNGVLLAQRCLNNHFGYNLSEDDVMGPMTLSAINRVDPVRFVNLFNGYRKKHYETVSNSATFLSGWLKRLKKFGVENPGLSVGSIVIVATIGFLIYQGITNQNI
ncbi:Predicted Peptidoglycan domain-containing protein [Zunongwangia mangrovi]|uniref:Predicted Peptidoglycan domain-containing protein n=1 Tax=Zunongwangia mangrovi TaxID=1334022 RepID=A0A1I1DC77_9FLAO|nr:glycosyl hydrolase 108 family protein [Zunongwangia mangrovi]SFB72437.1 Predicted Peptidoglycan domain-containing protein [Zunongwangia mangrovi]